MAIRWSIDAIAASEPDIAAGSFGSPAAIEIAGNVGLQGSKGEKGPTGGDSYLNGYSIGYRDGQYVAMYWFC